MINSGRYDLTVQERSLIGQLLGSVSADPSLEQIWALMDQAWKKHGCNSRRPEPARLAEFYKDPVWLLNGMFIEQHQASMGHRQAIAAAVARLGPLRVVDFGGGFGTLARLLAAALPQSDIVICDPFPPRHGVESCKPFGNIQFLPDLGSQRFDVLVCTDVLEHVEDPLSLLSAMVDAVRGGGHLLIANCFFPVIACHLPTTFHLRDSFDDFCVALGLEVLGPCAGSHATIYRRKDVAVPNWQRLRTMERRSKKRYFWREWRARYLTPWGNRIRLAIREPFHYPRKLFKSNRLGR